MRSSANCASACGNDGCAVAAARSDPGAVALLRLAARRRDAAVSNPEHQAMAGATRHTCRCRSKPTTSSRTVAAARHAARSTTLHGSEESETLEIEVRAVQAMRQRERELAQPKLPAACAKVLRSLRNHWEGLTRLTLFVEAPRPAAGQQSSRACAARPGGRAQELLWVGGAVER